MTEARELVKAGRRKNRSYSKETVVVRCRLSEEPRARPVLPFQQAAPDGYDQSRGWTAQASGIANGVLAQVPVGKILVESVSRISQTVLCCAVQCGAVRFSAVRLLCGRWVLSVQTSFTLIISARVDGMSLACQLKPKTSLSPGPEALDPSDNGARDQTQRMEV